MQRHAGSRWGAEPGNHAEEAGDRPQPQQLEGARWPSSPTGATCHPFSLCPHPRVELSAAGALQTTPGLTMWCAYLPHLLEHSRARGQACGLSGDPLDFLLLQQTIWTRHPQSISGPPAVSRQDSREGAGTFQRLPNCPGPRDFSWNSCAKTACLRTGALGSSVLHLCIP